MLWGCADDEPDIHGPSLYVPAEGGATVRATDDDDAGHGEEGSFAAAYAVFDTYCNSMPCHGGNTAGNLDLSSKGVAHDSLVNVAADSDECRDSDLLRVVPNEPDESLLLAKLEDEPTCGVQMPQGSMLAANHRATLRAWIEAGAPEE